MYKHYPPHHNQQNTQTNETKQNEPQQSNVGNTQTPEIIGNQTDETAISEEEQEVNRALSEIIPVEQALIRRIPVAERNNVLSLPDTISFTIGSAIDPRAFGVTLFNRLLRSGKFANFLSQAGKKMTK